MFRCFRSFLGVLRVVAPCLLLAASASTLRAALAFEPATIVLTPALGEKESRGEFRFKNTGGTPVRITKVHSGCLCTVPAAPAEAVAPGGEGALPVLYKPGDRQGRQESTLLVETSDGATHTLRLVVDLPVRVSFAPRLLLFRGDQREALEATVSYPADPKTGLLGVVLPSGGEFEVVGQPSINTEGVLKLSVRHVGDAGAAARGAARIRTRDSAGVEHVDLLYLRHTP